MSGKGLGIGLSVPTRLTDTVRDFSIMGSDPLPLRNGIGAFVRPCVCACACVGL